MPRSPSSPFNYAVPTGTAAVSGQVISSVAYNNFLADLTTALNEAWPVAYGGTGTTDGSALVPDGSAAAPAVRFQQETGSGLYRIGAADVGLSITGTGRAQWTATTYAPVSASSLTLGTSALGWGALFLSSASVGTLLTAMSTDAGAGAAPTVDLYRNSASPAAADILAEIDFTGQNSTPAKKTYASVNVRIDTATAASEAATMQIATMKAGTLTNYLTPGANAAGTATANAVGLPLGQLSFPAAQNASSDVNTLDDYEEGTFTPVVSFGGSSTSITYSTQSGTYVKVGRVVHYWIRVILSSKGAQTGQARLGGLPFTSDSTINNMAIAGGPWSNMATIVGNITGYVNVNAITIDLWMSGATSAASVTNSNFTNTSDLTVSGSYLAAA